jgi:hypothetical protein
MMKLLKGIIFAYFSLSLFFGMEKKVEQQDGENKEEQKDQIAETVLNKALMIGELKNNIALANKYKSNRVDIEKKIEELKNELQIIKEKMHLLSNSSKTKEELEKNTNDVLTLLFKYQGIEDKLKKEQEKIKIIEKYGIDIIR